MTTKNNLPCDLPKILFISGFPRSGTTWFANIFNSHPRILYRHEILGRQLSQLDKTLLDNLLHKEGLSEQQYEHFMQFLLSANINTDRPPFFNKDFLKISSRKIHQLAWLANNAVSLLNPAYRYLYKPNTNKLDYLLIKETRSTVNLQSILKGIRPSYTLFLVRHPCAVIASHLSGYASGNMTEPGENDRLTWYKNHKHSNTVGNYQLNEKDILNASIEEFLTYRWCAHIDDYIHIANANQQVSIVIYEQLLTEPEIALRALFNQLDIAENSAFNTFLQKSQETATVNILNKDSSNEFYSIFRSGNFDPEKWKKTLSKDTQQFILDKTQVIREHLNIN